MKRIVAAIVVLLAWTWIPPADTPASEKRSVVDDAGRKVEIPAVPGRIVVLNSSNLEILYAVGGKAVGRPESTGMPRELYGRVRHLPSIGETPSPNVEKIASLSPDLVIGVNMPFHHALLPALSRAGIPVLLLSINSYEDIIEKIRFFGTLTGNTGSAARIIADIEQKTDGIKRAASLQKKQKIAIIWGSPQSFTMALPASFPGNLIGMLGGINIAEGVKPAASMSHYAPLSLEYILSKDPDIIFLITHGYDGKVSEKFRKEMESHPAWNGLRAVREGRLYPLPFSLFGVNPAVRVTKAVEHIAALLYPDLSRNRPKQTGADRK